MHCPMVTKKNPAMAGFYVEDAARYAVTYISKPLS